MPHDEPLADDARPGDAQRESARADARTRPGAVPPDDGEPAADDVVDYEPLADGATITRPSGADGTPARADAGTGPGMARPGGEPTRSPG